MVLEGEVAKPIDDVDYFVGGVLDSFQSPETMPFLAKRFIF